MENCPNIYKTARITAGLTQEGAADALDVSASSLKDYETYTRIPPNCIVERMVEVYGSMVLAYQHIRLTAGSIQVLPEVQQRDLATAAIRLNNRFVAFCRKNRGQELLEIAEDGKITEDEWPLFYEIVEELKALTQASIELELAPEKA